MTDPVKIARAAGLTVEDLTASEIVRGIRARRGWNQKELARAVGLPRSTISRIEAERVTPNFATMRAILEASGFVFVVALADREYEPVVAGRTERIDLVRDRAGRRPPAHLPRWLIENEADPWWGWARIAWSRRDPLVPEYTYAGRRWRSRKTSIER